MKTSELYAIDTIVFKQIQEDKKKTEATNKAYFEGMEKGADLFCKAIRDFLNKEEDISKMEISTERGAK